MVKKAAQATPNRLLKAARKEQSWTQQEVADRIGAPLALNVSRWESGTAFPSAYYLQRLCHLFGKSPRELGLSQLGEEGAVIRPPTLEPGQQIPPEPETASSGGETTALHVPPSTSTAQVQGSHHAGLLAFRDTSLPLPLTPLIGREQDVAAVCAL